MKITNVNDLIELYSKGQRDFQNLETRWPSFYYCAKRGLYKIYSAAAALEASREVERVST